MSTLLLLIAQILAPAVAKLLAAYLTKLAAQVGGVAARDDFADVAFDIVAGIDRDHPDWTNATKREWAIGALAQHAANVRADVSDSLINATVELAVVRARAKK